MTETGPDINLLLMDQIRVLLVDDHKIIRDGLRALLEKQTGITVIADAADGRAAVRLAEELKPDVIVMDVSMPDLNGIEATRQITERLPAVRIVALSMHSDKRFVTQILHAGASGYLLKDCAFEELEIAIRAVASNQTYLSAKMTDVVVKDYLRTLPKNESSAFSVLTNRERETLQMIAEGKTTKEIAATLGISVKTVETHRQRTMEKLRDRQRRRPRQVRHPRRPHLAGIKNDNDSKTQRFHKVEYLVQ